MLASRFLKVPIQIQKSNLQLKLLSTVSPKREKLVILGTGWGGYSVLKNVNKEKFDVIVVSPRNHFLFTPLLASTTVGTLEFRSIIQPIRESGFRDSAHFHLSHASKLDMKNKVLHCESVLTPDLQYTIDYDKLVIAVGALSNTFGVPGVEEHAFFLKEVVDARKIRNRILNNFELSLGPKTTESESRRLLHTVIVGGGPTGVEFGAELYDFVQQDVAKLYRQKQKEVTVTLVESDKILGSFDARLQKHAEKKIQARERFKLVKSSVTEVYNDSVKLQDGTIIPCGLVVWSTGLAPRWFTSHFNVPKNKRGQILTDGCLRVVEDPNQCVYAVGDCADIKDRPLPCTAQVAEKQGKYLSEVISGKTSPAAEFEFKNMGMLAYVGGYQGLTDTPKVKLRDLFVFSGFTSWLLWRSAYLTRLGSWRLRMQVPMDWLKTLLFGRDISRFD
ncbi:hypothetical protein LOTGIDRAFT_224073 [Lottia gigantea]|uniref:Uncharacterized protein n=1 Tax=Lottia gigantea TaxID=225164 RepID=V4AJ50_LOTGI|nr:hypothetical protein LOTGIDRAFT_224073 [Lottia gigantea]ESP04189.1 hypothetical protein LOTGIDRAFT_224073 [Lottia gigantea]